MFYGRVDVYWPDGPIESYRLNKSVIAIGRSTGNDIVLDTTSISRYHVKLTFNNSQQALIEDLESVNGTYVDNVRLQPHESYTLRGGEEVQIGDILLHFHPPTGTDTQISADAETTQRILRTQATYKTELEGPDMAVTPGAHGQATLKIENLGDETDHYTIEVEGLPKGWARVDRVEMEIEAKGQDQAVISFKPLRRSETQPGDYALIVRVRSRANPTQTVEMPTTLQVLPFNGFGMALGSLHTGEKGQFTLYIHNQGNGVLPLSLQGTDPAQKLAFKLPRGPFQLGPGERQTITGIVRLRRSQFWGPAREREFAILARAQNASNFVASVPGFYTEKGMLPSWMPILIVPLMALVVLAAIGLILLISDSTNHSSAPPPPVITSFTASSPVLTLGENITVTWNVSQVSSIELVTDRAGVQQRYPVQDGATSFALPFEQTGRYTLILEAHNGKTTSTATALIDVQPNATLGLTVLGGTQLVRNVQGEVRVTWNVNGANPLDSGYNIWLQRADQNQNLLSAPQPTAGQQDIQVVPQDDQTEWLVTLYAEGQDSVIASATQKLPVVYPICELRVAQTIVRSGPGEHYPAILPPQPPEGSPAGTLSYSPVARDPDGKWLKVIIGVTGRPGWVARADFQCTNFDPDRLVSTTDYPPPPDTTSGESTAPTPVAPTPTPRSSLPVLTPTTALAVTAQGRS